MSKTVWNVLVWIGVALCVASCIVAFAMGGCSTCIETVTGACIPMKCHWTMRAVGIMGIISAFVFAGLAPVKCKIGRRWLAISTIIIQAFILLSMYTPIMGLCSDAAMHCHATARICAILAALVIIDGLVITAKADPKAAKLPKKEL